jgi:hypothetical protein
VSGGRGGKALPLAPKREEVSGGRSSSLHWHLKEREVKWRRGSKPPLAPKRGGEWGRGSGLPVALREEVMEEDGSPPTGTLREEVSGGRGGSPP